MKFNTPGNYSYDGFGRAIFGIFLFIIIALSFLMNIKLFILLIILFYIILFIVGCVADKNKTKQP